MPVVEEVNETEAERINANRQQNQNNNHGSSLNRIITYLFSNKIELALWLTRLITIVFSLCFVLPIFGVHPMSAYQKTLICCAATSALRLHQRVPNFQFNREYFGFLFLEDSAHYLFYCLIFITTGPVSMSVIPLFLYAVMHAQNYTKQLLNQVGPNSFTRFRGLLSKIETHQVNILRSIASVEIFMMPLSIISLFTSRGSILLPILYHQFLSMRYVSRRNPYCRQIFYELNLTTRELISRPGCPHFIRLSVQKIIYYISKTAPSPQPAN